MGVKNACTTIANTICECKAGHGGGSCVACVAGTTFKILAGDAACTACATCGTGRKVKTACTTIANTICECKAGHGGGSCVACVAGTTFKILAGDAACTACATCGT